MSDDDGDRTAGQQVDRAISATVNAVQATGSFFDGVVDKLFAVKPSPGSFADITLSDDVRRTQQRFLRDKGLMSHEEHLVAFYNNALVSPLGEDKTNTCVFLTEARVVQVKNSQVDIERQLDDLGTVTVEHNSIFSDDYLVLVPKVGPDIAKLEMVRESVANSFKQLIEKMIGRTEVLLLEFKQLDD